MTILVMSVMIRREQRSDLVCILTWIQLEFGCTTCCRTVPHTDSSERTKLRAEGGKPQTVIQVSRGEQSGEVVTSCGWVEVVEVLFRLGGERRLLLLKLAEPGLEVETLLGVKRREVVGGPPVFSLPDLEEFMFSFSSPGPLSWPDRTGVCGLELAGGGWVERERLSLLGDTMGLREEGVPGDWRTGSPIRKPGR